MTQFKYRSSALCSKDRPIKSAILCSKGQFKIVFCKKEMPLLHAGVASILVWARRRNHQFFSIFHPRPLCLKIENVLQWLYLVDSLKGIILYLIDCWKYSQKFTDFDSKILISAELYYFRKCQEIFQANLCFPMLLHHCGFRLNAFWTTKNKWKFTKTACKVVKETQILSAICSRPIFGCPAVPYWVLHLPI